MRQTRGLPLRQSRRVTHPQIHWNLSLHGPAADRAVRRDLRLALARQARREAGRPRRGLARRLLALRGCDARAAHGRGRLADRRPRRGLPLLDAHAPAHPAGRPRAAAAAALALARDHAPGHPPASAIERTLGRFAHPVDRSSFLWFGARLLLAHPGALRRRARASVSCTRLEHATFFTAGTRSGGR